MRSWVPSHTKVTFPLPGPRPRRPRSCHGRDGRQGFAPWGLSRRGCLLKQPEMLERNRALRSEIPAHRFSLAEPEEGARCPAEVQNGSQLRSYGSVRMGWKSPAPTD